MFYLRHPFLTSEEVTGFSRELGKKEKWMAEKKAARIKPYRPDVTLEQRLVTPLNVKNVWD